MSTDHQAAAMQNISEKNMVKLLIIVLVIIGAVFKRLIV